VKWVEAIAGCGRIVGGALLLVAWESGGKHPDQKKLGFGCIAIGCLLVLAALYE